MKRTLLISSVILSLSAAGGATAASKFIAADSSKETKLCMIAVDGTAWKMRVEIRKQRTTQREVARNVLCNDKNIVRFADRHGNQPVHAMLVRHLRPTVIIYPTAAK